MLQTDCREFDIYDKKAKYNVFGKSCQWIHRESNKTLPEN